jgi:hypothetical protein
MTLLHMPQRQLSAQDPPPPRTLVQDERFYFYGYGIHPSSCRLRVFGNRRDIVVVLTQDKLNHGTSVTNAIEQIASELLPFLVSHSRSARHHHLDRALRGA